MPIEMPPLRERGNDILILAKHFADAFAKENKLGTIHFSEGARKKLLNHSFPGNVRELKSVVELAGVMCENNEILPDDITFNSVRQQDTIIDTGKTLRQHTCDIVQFYLRKNNGDVILLRNNWILGRVPSIKCCRRVKLQPDLHSILWRNFSTKWKFRNCSYFILY
jgi:two-component system, NtrC family, response regulator AtoC